MIPLILRLKKAAHREVAKAQDLLVETLYSIFDKAVFHGGTSIWRCYNGNRFSEDVDFYINKDLEKINMFFKTLEKNGFIIKKKKIGERNISSTLSFNNTIVQFEAVFKNIKGILKEYETVEGNFLTVYTLSPEDLIKEKVAAYIDRNKVRDIYDIFFLLRYTKEISPIEKTLKELLTRFKKPNDESDLKVLIFEGIVPDSEKMIEYIKRQL